MKRTLAIAVFFLLAGCHHRPPERPIITTDTIREESAPVVPSEDTQPPDNVDVPTQALADAPPCLPVDPNIKISPKPHRPVARAPAPPPPEPVTPPPAPVAEATVKPTESLSGSVLGKKVHSAQGEDLGRVVDVLADARGHVRIAIIEFGGFLGVGLRRVAVDWSLLKFRPTSPDTPFLLDVSKHQLQTAPEYKDSEHPMALMAPPAAAALSAPVSSALAPGADPTQ